MQLFLHCKIYNVFERVHHESIFQTTFLSHPELLQ